ncbi:MAG: hypothetical protein IPG50_31940 [Myxococcales bacterium]|nr:hypothetical protein [Myxococcales bacterium]
MRHRVLSLLLSSALVALVACSPSIEKPEYDGCSGKKKAACAAASASGSDDGGTTLYAAPVPDAARIVVDAGSDASLRKPDGGRPSLPPPNFACRDLSRCCRAIRSSIERAACIAVVYKAKPSVCSTALIGYQLFGCGHQPFDIGGILPGGFGSGYDNDGDGTPDFVDDNTPPPYTLDDYCAEYPEECPAAGAATYDTGWTDPGAPPPIDDPSYLDFGPPVDPNANPDPSSFPDLGSGGGSYDPFGTPDPGSGGGSYDPFGTPTPDPGSGSDGDSGDFGDWWW